MDFFCWKQAESFMAFKHSYNDLTAQADSSIKNTCIGKDAHSRSHQHEMNKY